MRRAYRKEVRALMPPDRRRAAIYIQHNKQHPDRQETLALRHAEAAELDVVALCSDPATCLALIRSGAVSVLVSALPLDADVVDDVEAAGGVVAVVRDEHGVPRPRREVRSLAARMASRGMEVPEIAEILDLPTGEVRRLLRRKGGNRWLRVVLVPLAVPSLPDALINILK